MSYALACNAGSSSLKFALFSWPNGRRVGGGRIERIGQRNPMLRATMFGQEIDAEAVPARNHRLAAQVLYELLATYGVTPAAMEIIGHRIVFGGRLNRTTRITALVERFLRTATDVAPLHNPPAMAVYRLLRGRYPRVPTYACFDSAYFRSLPPLAATYAIDRATSRRYGIRRYGFHGLSHAQAARQAAAVISRPLRRCNLVTIHLGAGCSMTAVAKGMPVDTTMGFSPLEGLVMGTRSGDIDAGVILHLLRCGWTLGELEELLNERSGLRGVSGYSADMRDVLIAAGFRIPGYVPERAATAPQRRRSKFAFELFTYRIRKYLGAFAATLGRIDAIVFTGAIGTGNIDVRRAALRGLRLPGRPRTVLVATDEEAEVFRELRRLRR